MNDELKKFLYLAAAFLTFYFMPVDSPRLQAAAIESLAMLHE